MTWSHAVTSRRDIRTSRTSRRDIMRSHHNVTWHHMTWQSESAQVNPSETPEITFFNLATLTYDLDHRTPPRYTQGQSPYQIIGPYVKRFCSWERQLTDRRTHTQTHGTDFIPLTADAGGNNDSSKGKFWVLNMKMLDFSISGSCYQ